MSRVGRPRGRRCAPAWVYDLSDEDAHEPANWPPATLHEFDWQVPSDVMYADEQAGLCGKFQAARQKLDYQYHKRPAEPRQLLQDAILAAVLDSTPADAQGGEAPRWVVFTAGAMGVGKSYALLTLYNQGRFPLGMFVPLDPDKLKSELPELAGYVEYEKASAATKVHRESTLMADVLFEHCLLHGRSILIDGSLRDVAWHTKLFKRIRSEFPKYRIAILHVTARESVVLSRAATRAEHSHRQVPTALILDSLRQVPDSVRRLTPLADVVAEVENNDSAELRLARLARVCAGRPIPSRSPSWQEFKDVWPHHGVCPSLCHNPATLCAGSTSKRLQSASFSAYQRLWGRTYKHVCARCVLEGEVECGDVCSCHAKHTRRFAFRLSKVLEEVSLAVSTPSLP